MKFSLPVVCKRKETTTSALDMNNSIITAIMRQKRGRGKRVREVNEGEVKLSHMMRIDNPFISGEGTITLDDRCESGAALPVTSRSEDEDCLFSERNEPVFFSVACLEPVQQSQ